MLGGSFNGKHGSATPEYSACELALTKLKSPRYHHLNGILMSNQDIIWMANKSINKMNDDGGYIRGADYYGGKYND